VSFPPIAPKQLPLRSLSYHTSLFSWLRFYLLSSVLFSLSFEIKSCRSIVLSRLFGYRYCSSFFFPLLLHRVLSGKEVFTTRLLMTHYDPYVLRRVVFVPCTSRAIACLLTVVARVCLLVAVINVVYTLLGVIEGDGLYSWLKSYVCRITYVVQ